MLLYVIAGFTVVGFISWSISRALGAYINMKHTDPDDVDNAKKELGKDLQKIGAFCFAVSVVLLFGFNKNIFWLLVLGLLIGFIMVVTGAFLLQEGEAKDAERRKNYCQIEAPQWYNEKLVVSDTGPLVGEVLHYTAEHETYQHYEPLKTHVGGAVVGGIFSGGVYTTGGEMRTYIGAKTGFYDLFYYDKKSVGLSEGERYHGIKRIVLKGKAAEMAKKSPAISAVLMGVDELYLETKGTKEYCKMVKDWLSQESRRPAKHYQLEPNKELEEKYKEKYKNMSPEELEKYLEEVANKLDRLNSR